MHNIHVQQFMYKILQLLIFAAQLILIVQYAIILFSSYA